MNLWQSMSHSTKPDFHWVPDRTASMIYDDDDILARTGKTPVLKRSFGFISILGFSLLVLSTWFGAFAIFGDGLQNGGPAGLIYTFIIVWIGTMATFTSLAELASMAPTAAGQYHWVSILAPRSSQKFLSYLTGWLTVLGWQASVASSSYVLALFVQGFIELVDGSYKSQLWHATLFMYAGLLISVLANIVGGRFLPILETVLLVFYILGFFALLVPLVVLAPHVSAHEVFTTFINNGGWSTQSLSFFVGISGNAFAFLGADSVYHMSEEIHNAATTVPKAMIWGLIINGIVGLAMYIALLFCAGNLQEDLHSKFEYPSVKVLLRGTQSTAGTGVLLMVLIMVDLSLVIGVVAASSRMLWSFARDRGVPFWRQLVKVNKHSSIPLVSIFTTTVFSLLIGLISIGSPVAFNDVISLTVVALYASYFIACALLLYRRITGSITDPLAITSGYEAGDEQQSRQHNHAQAAGTTGLNMPGTGGKHLTWGPWRVREPFGTIINAFACVYLIIVFVFSFFPPATPVDSATMNYACVVFGAVVLGSGVYYVLVANRVFKGPVVEMSLEP